MKYPTLSVLETGRDMIQAFGGYNHNLRIGDGEFYDMKNLTSTHYPILSPRPKRGTYAPDEGETEIDPQGLISKDSLGYVDGMDFVLNEHRIFLNLKLNQPKTLISMGAYVIILPDKKYVNTENINDYGSIEATWTQMYEENVTFELCTIEGSVYEDVVTNEPTTPTDKQYWLDTSSKPNVLKQYSKTSAMWVTIPTTYIKITAPNIANRFNQYDGVHIEGILNESLSDLNSNMIIWAKKDGAGDDDETGDSSSYIVVTGILDSKITQPGSDGRVSISRKMPEMDFITESENRLWGCKYGPNENGDVVNEIYASKLGDFKNWNCFMGLSTDSYVASVGTDGQFTAAATHLGYPLFFKENCIHKVYGNYPANYQIQTTSCRGVAKGSERSLAEVNEILYYKSRNGVCAYDGSLPTEISSALGDVSYSDAVAGCLGNKYYISMKDSTGEYNLFVYDTQRGMWHREDNTQVKQFCNCRGDLYYIDSGKHIKSILGSKTKDKDPVSWMAETGIIGMEYPDKKYISRLLVRMSLEIGARARFYIEYDSCGSWEYMCSITGTNLRSFAVPIKPKRCDHFRFKIEGEGDAKIFSIVKTTEQGSDI